jgi:Kef-type K+ transport system membrane component KefB
VDFAQLALICGVAIIGPVLSLQRWLHLPVVIGELLVGVGLGATGLRALSATDPTFAFLAEAGFALVMFEAGSHVPLRNPALRGGLRVGAARAVAVGALAVAAGLLVARLFGTDHALLYAVLATSSSASLIMPALNGLPLTAPAIVNMLPQVAIADAACIVLVPLVMDPPNAARAALGVLVVGAAGALVWALLRWVQVSGTRRRIHEVSEERELALELRTLLTLLFGLAAVAVAVKVSVMLAGFAMGLAVAGVGEPRRVAKQLFAITEGLFAPIFFVWLGASLNLRDLAAHPSAIGLGVALGVVAVLAHSAMVLTGQPLPVAAVTAAQLGVPVAAVKLASDQGGFAAGEPTALLLGALVTIAVTAIVSLPLGRVAVAGEPPDAAAALPPPAPPDPAAAI